MCVKVLPGGGEKKKKKEPALTAHTSPASPTAALTLVRHQRLTYFAHTHADTHPHAQTYMNCRDATAVNQSTMQIIDEDTTVEPDVLLIFIMLLNEMSGPPEAANYEVKQKTSMKRITMFHFSSLWPYLFSTITFMQRVASFV